MIGEEADLELGVKDKGVEGPLIAFDARTNRK